MCCDLSVRPHDSARILQDVTLSLPLRTPPRTHERHVSVSSQAHKGTGRTLVSSARRTSAPPLATAQEEGTQGQTKTQTTRSQGLDMTRTQPRRARHAPCPFDALAR